MAEMYRFSSRRQRLDHSFLANRLKGAKSYKRIAGYFYSSIFELRYKKTIDPDKNQWELCSRVLVRKDVVEKLSEAW